MKALYAIFSSENWCLEAIVIKSPLTKEYISVKKNKAKTSYYSDVLDKFWFSMYFYVIRGWIYNKFSLNSYLHFRGSTSENKAVNVSLSSFWYLSSKSFKWRSKSSVALPAKLYNKLAICGRLRMRLVYRLRKDFQKVYIFITISTW